MTDTDLEIRPIAPSDAGEVLTLQRAAFVQEALIYGSVDMPVFTQSLEELAYELRGNLGQVALRGARMVGAIRARRDGEALLIGRLAIAPDQQGGGIGSALLDAVEELGRSQGARVAELFTGRLSEANIRLYERQGYEVSETAGGAQGDDEVFLRKRLDAP